MSAGNINYQSPLAAALLTQTRFKSGLARGDLSLLTCHVQISQSTDQSIKTAIREMLSQLTIEFSFSSAITVRSLAIIHPVELTYEDYKMKHELYKSCISQSTSQSSSQSTNPSRAARADIISFENVSRVVDAKSNDILSNGFVLLTPIEFCTLVTNQTLDALITQSLARCKMAHFIIYGLPAYITTVKTNCPFRSLNDFMSSITQLWLKYCGRAQFHWQSLDEYAAAKEFAAAIRQTCAAESKQSQEAAQFQFGGMRAVKARTAAMRGARETSRASGRASRPNNQSNDDESDSESDADAADFDESWRLFLTLIRGVSEDKAVVIARAFPSLRSLLDHYKHLEASGPDGVREAEIALADLRCGNRRIGEAISQRVFKKLWKERSGQTTRTSV